MKMEDGFGAQKWKNCPDKQMTFSVAVTSTLTMMETASSLLGGDFKGIWSSLGCWIKNFQFLLNGDPFFCWGANKFLPSSTRGEETKT